MPKKTQSMSLLGAKRTWTAAVQMSASDPKRTFSSLSADKSPRIGAPCSISQDPLLTVQTSLTKPGNREGSVFHAALPERADWLRGNFAIIHPLRCNAKHRKPSILHSICELLRHTTIVRAGFALQVASHRIDEDS